MSFSQFIQKNNSLLGFQGIDLNKVFFLLKERERLNLLSYHDNTIRSLISILVKVFFYKYKLVIPAAQNSQTKVLFFYDYEYNYKRKDYELIFNNVADTIKDNKDIIYYERTESYCFSFLTTLKLLLLVPTWFLKLRGISGSIKIKNFYIIRLIELYRFKNQILKIKLNNYTLITVFFDLSYNCNLLVQLAQNQMIKTATLQHGIMLSQRNLGILDFAAPEFRGGISDYFLLWNQFTYNEAIKQGIYKERLRILGINRCINVNKPKHHHNHVFGVILDGIHTDRNNRFLIQSAKKLAQINGYNYYIKIHPNSDSKLYNKFILDSQCLGIFNPSFSFHEYLNFVEFSIVGNSTALFEMTYLGHKFYRYSSNIDTDKFRDAAIPSFSNMNELICLYEEKESKDIFKNVCTIENIEAEYSLFFNSFLTD